MERGRWCEYSCVKEASPLKRLLSVLLISPRINIQQTCTAVTLSVHALVTTPTPLIKLGDIPVKIVTSDVCAIKWSFT